MDIRLIVLDLDGTTLNSEGSLSKNNRRTLERAIDGGIHVAVATGRGLTSIPEEVKQIRGLEYLITSNGAKIYDVHRKETVFSSCIDESAVQPIASLLKECGHIVEVFVDGIAYIEEKDYSDIIEGRFVGRHREYVRTTRTPIRGIVDFMLENKDGIENINIFFQEQWEKEEMFPRLMELPNVTITTSLVNNWEIGGVDTNKGNAVGEICRMLGLDVDQVMAFGDSPNDVEMLKTVGMPVAVGNAKREVKDVARYVTGTNDEDGVAMAIEAFAFVKDVK